MLSSLTPYEEPGGLRAEGAGLRALDARRPQTLRLSPLRQKP